MNFIFDTKILKEQAKYKKHCTNCGHTMTFFIYEKDRKCCSYCGTFNYKNDLIKFKYKLMEKGVKVQKCV